MKRILSLFLCLALLFGISMQAYATGDPNINGGGGGMGDGTSSNYWNPGMDGVRVTIVEADSHSVASASVDLTNKTPSANIIDFGKVCKLSYNGGGGLSPQVNSYSYRNPAQSLPRIISSGSAGASIEAIRSYFTDAQVLQSLCGYIGFDFESLISGEYKLMVEPLAYFCYSGLQYAMTATEAALYDQQVNGGLRSWMGSLTHKNLPLAIFLQTPDLGYPAWSGSKTQKVSNADILSSLGIGIVRFTELPEPPEILTFDYEYRTDTDVITSVEVSGGQADPDNPVSVQFNIQGRTYTVDNVYYPDGDSQLAWVGWHTPDEPCVVTIYVSVTGSGAAQSIITANVISLDGKDPPNPLADDRNDSFAQSPVPEQPEVTSASWGIWSPWWQEFWEWVPDWDKCWHSDWVDTSYTDADGNEVSDGYWDDWYHWVDNGYWEDHGWWEFDYESYSASLTANMNITPDDKSPTSTASTLKSGYGIQESVTARVRTDQSAAVTAAQNAVTYFPEFQYLDYWRLLDRTVTGKSSSFEFKENRYSTYDRRTHFTPIWYPDGAYVPYTYVLDCWTPAGMLSMNLTDSVTVRGNLWEEWHIAPSKP
ncbi:MAG TPA: hypothetical protein DD735_01985 [Clostridiales bacterium]|jgi:hypothetical protein|nr:hypothetical protein [Clostridiales bacterium]